MICGAIVQAVCLLPSRGSAAVCFRKPEVYAGDYRLASGIPA